MSLSSAYVYMHIYPLVLLKYQPPKVVGRMNEAARVIWGQSTCHVVHVPKPWAVVILTCFLLDNFRDGSKINTSDCF